MSAVALAVLAAFLFAWAAGLQQRAGRDSLRTSDRGSTALSRRLPIARVARRLVRHPLWLTGWLVNLAGFLTQAVALQRGSVAVVQPVLVTQLLFTLYIAAARARRYPERGELLAGLLICLGIALFVQGWGTEHLGEDPREGTRPLMAVLSALVLALALVALSVGRRQTIRVLQTSVAAGLCFAVSAVLMKLTSDSLIDDGVGATATDWPGYLLAVSTVLGLAFGQDALMAGALPLAVVGMVITNPGASALIGVLALGENGATDPFALAGMALGGLVITIGVVLLAQSPTVRGDAAAAREAHRGAHRVDVRRQALEG